MKKELLKKLNELRTSEDLERENLSLSDYHTIGSVVIRKSALVHSKGVASWFKRNGALVKLTNNGLYFIQM